MLSTEEIIKQLQRPGGKDIFTDLYERIAALEKRVEELENASVGG